jgi:hypothetical protein
MITIWHAGAGRAALRVIKNHDGAWRQGDRKKARGLVEKADGKERGEVRLLTQYESSLLFYLAELFFFELTSKCLPYCIIRRTPK